MKRLIVMLLVPFFIAGCAKAITLEEAKEIALKEVNGQVMMISKEGNDGKGEYEVIISTDDELHELKIDFGGNITSHKTEEKKENDKADESDSQKKSNSENKSNDQSNEISEKEAQTIALDRVGGGKVTKSKLDTDDGVLEYEIEILYNRVEYEVTVNATTKKITSFEKDN